MFANIGFRATLSSRCAGLIPTVRCLYLKGLSLVWKTVKYLDDSSNSICQKSYLKSIFEKILQPVNFELMSSCRGIGWFVPMIALFTFLAQV